MWSFWSTIYLRMDLLRAAVTRNPSRMIHWLESKPKDPRPKAGVFFILLWSLLIRFFSLFPRWWREFCPSTLLRRVSSTLSLTSPAKGEINASQEQVQTRREVVQPCLETEIFDAYPLIPKFENVFWKSILPFAQTGKGLLYLNSATKVTYGNAESIEFLLF